MTWAFLIVLFVALAAFATYRAAKRWWEFLIVFAPAAALLFPFFKLTGDISAIIPGVWNDGPDGKDEIILVTIVATFMWPLFTAAVIVWAVKKAIGKQQNGRAQ